MHRQVEERKESSATAIVTQPRGNSHHQIYLLCEHQGGGLPALYSTAGMAATAAPAASTTCFASGTIAQYIIDISLTEEWLAQSALSGLCKACAHPCFDFSCNPLALQGRAGQACCKPRPLPAGQLVVAVVVDGCPTQLRADYHSLGQAAEAAGPPAMPVQHQRG